jgi:hypothetical protein
MAGKMPVPNARLCLGVSNADTAGLSAYLLRRFDYIEVAGP